MKYTIPCFYIDDVLSKLKRIIRKCKNQNIDYTLDIGEEYEYIIKKGEKRWSVHVRDINVDIFFKQSGWSVLGCVQRKDGIVQAFFDDCNLIKEYKNTDFHCDHCKKNVYRNSVVLLENECGERKLVGSSCVKEFTSGLDGDLVTRASDILFYISKLNHDLDRIREDDDDIEEYCNSISAVPMYRTVSVLSYTVDSINKYGWGSAKSLNATWKYVLNDVIDGNPNYTNDESLNAIDWILSIENPESISCYMFNLQQIVKEKYCSVRYFPMLCSLIPTYRKHIQTTMCKSESEYVGEVNEKLLLKVCYTNTFTFETKYGYGHIHLFVDENGNIFKWSTNKSLSFSLKDPIDGSNITFALDKFSIIKLSGTVKEHCTYNNAKQTVLTRCKYEVLVSDLMNEKLYEMEHARNEDPKNVLDALDVLLDDEVV
jgi:hypothetical protein